MGVMWPRIGLNASPLSEMVFAQKPQIGSNGLGLRSLYSTDSVGGWYTGYCRIGNDPLF